MSPALPHRLVGPVPVFEGDGDAAVSFCLDAIRRGDGAWVATANLDYLARARRDPELRTLLKQASIVVADGAPVAWLARIAGARHTTRLAGVDLVAELFQRSTQPLRVALYGSTPRIAEAAAARFQATYPNVQVAAVICPPFAERTPAQEAYERGLLCSVAPDVVLVALGCPKQEHLIASYREACPGAVWIGVGGTFDFYAGRRRRAPRVVQRIGGEWLVRLAQEPGRLWRRYFLHDIPALFATAPFCLAARLRTRSTSPATE